MNANVKFTKVGLGKYFQYMERETAAAELYAMLRSQYGVMLDALGSLRAGMLSSDLWEEHKRQVQVVITHGLGGSGKSRFAREAVKFYAKKLLSTGVFESDADRLFAELISDDIRTANIRVGECCYCAVSISHSFLISFIMCRRRSPGGGRLCLGDQSGRGGCVPVPQVLAHRRN